MLINYIAYSLVFMGIFIGAYIIVYKGFIDRTLNKKLKKPKLPKSMLSKPSGSLLTRLGSRLTPTKNRLLKYTPQNLKKWVETAILFSGTDWQIGDIILLKILLLIFSLGISIFLGTLLHGTARTVVILILIALAFFIPDLVLLNKSEKRRQSIRRSLPPFIDYLTIAVEAGLGLDMAIMRVISQIRGPLAEEIANAMTEIKYGKSKKEAFKNLTIRVNIPEFTSFIAALINGEQLGVSLGTILRVQSQQIREKRKQKIQEMAYQIPVKLTFPLVLFIFPGLFIVLLGPAVIQIFDTILK